jgi:hypothetical protein
MFLLYLIHTSSVLSLIPVLIMLLHKKTLFQRRYGWGLFGYFSNLAFAAFVSYLSCYLFGVSYVAYHFSLPFLMLAIYWLFKDEFTNKSFKRITLILFIISLVSEVLEFSFENGFKTNNNITYSIVNFSFIALYLLYLLDTFNNQPSIIFDKKSPFSLFNLLFFYSINQLLFSVIEEDIADHLLDSNYAVIIWSIFVSNYIFFLILSSYFLWKNLRS